MASLPILTVIQQSQVSPPPATVIDASLPLTSFDIFYLLLPTINFLFFYHLPLTTIQFTETIVPKLKHSLSITLQHFFPYAGNLIVFPTRSRKPEIRYEQGDSVSVTFAESNLDFHYLTGYHPRNCDKFYHLIPLLGDCQKTSDHMKIPVFSVQVTVFPNCGLSIGLNVHHSLVDAITHFNFLKAWTSITRCGTDESFLADGTSPIFDRLVNYPKRDELFLERTKLESFNEEDYQLPRLSGPIDKVRATFVLTRNFINKLKERVITNSVKVPYATSFTVTCAYIWSCLAKSRNDERQVFAIPVDCRARLDPPIPAAYFGNCLLRCRVIAETSLLIGEDGFLTAAKLIGENLHKLLTDKDGIRLDDLLSDDHGIPTTLIAAGGTPKLKLYDVDFGWGKPKKIEWVSLDHGASISVDAGKESDQDLEIGVCLKPTHMDAFVRHFNLGLES